MEQSMRMTSKFFGIAVGLIGLTVGVHAQTLEAVMAGSSAQFLQLGLAAGTGISASPAGLGFTCVWTQSSSGTGVTALDVTDRFTPPGEPPVTRSETGNAWVAWTPTGTNCTTINARTKIYAMVQTDSVIGSAEYFNNGTIGSVSGSAPTGTTSGLLFPGSEQSTLPSGIWTALNSAMLTAAATDIRPEDAKFTMERGLTSCGSSVSGSQYLGLGYHNGDKIFSAFGGSSASFVNVLNFTLPTDGSYTVIPIGASPILVTVNTLNASDGFGSLAFGGSTPANITRQTLAKFLDGSYGYTGDISAATAGTGASAAILIPEPFSGAYNTMEYSVPDTSDLNGMAGLLNTSQDVGTNQLPGQSNCDGSAPGGYNPTLGGYQMVISTDDNPTANRVRVIGTAQSIKELSGATDSIGYAFWSTANYAPAAANAKYLTVDGYDPLYNRPAGSSACTVGSTTVPYSTISNTLPTAANTYLACVQFTDLQNGNYPIWSLLRLVTTSTTTSPNYIAAGKLAFAAQNFISTTNHPDFVPFSNNGTTGIPLLQVLHSHFAPQGVTFRSWDPTVNPTGDPSNGANAFGGTTGGAAPNCTMVEAGGDVGGAILTVSSDNTYCGTHTQAGQINQRQ
jgi:hypothetical protein